MTRRPDQLRNRTQLDDQKLLADFRADLEKYILAHIPELDMEYKVVTSPNGSLVLLVSFMTGIDDLSMATKQADQIESILQIICQKHNLNSPGLTLQVMSHNVSALASAEVKQRAVSAIIEYFTGSSSLVISPALRLDRYYDLSFQLSVGLRPTQSRRKRAQKSDHIYDYILDKSQPNTLPVGVWVNLGHIVNAINAQQKKFLDAIDLRYVYEKCYALNHRNFVTRKIEEIEQYLLLFGPKSTSNKSDDDLSKPRADLTWLQTNQSGDLWHVGLSARSRSQQALVKVAHVIVQNMNSIQVIGIQNKCW